jgi:cytochrome P450 PksS
MLDLDEPDHTRLRSLVQKAFTPVMAERLQERIQAICEQLLDQVEGRHSMDLVQAYALQVPLTVIIELLGTPGRDRERFHRWAKAIVKTPTTFNMVRAMPSLMAFLRYLRRLFRELRSKPQDGLLTALVQVEEAGDRLNEDELLAMAFLLLIAGHETTVNLIASPCSSIPTSWTCCGAIHLSPELRSRSSCGTRIRSKLRLNATPAKM